MSPGDSIDRPNPHAGIMYRTRMCKFGKACHYRERCFYAHSQEQLRRRDGSASSTPACTVSDSVHRSSRRSSAVLSEINHDMSSFMAESVTGSAHRLSACADAGENMYALGLPSPMIGPIVTNLCDVSRSSYESVRDSSAAGSVSPMSVASSAAREDSSAVYSYCYFYIQYMLGAYRPDDLAQLLTKAAPEYYTD